MADEFEFSNFVPGLTEVVDDLTTATAALASDKNETIQFQDHGVAVEAKGDIWYVNFGDGITVTVTGPNTITISVP